MTPATDEQGTTARAEEVLAEADWRLRCKIAAMWQPQPHRDWPPVTVDPEGDRETIQFHRVNAQWYLRVLRRAGLVVVAAEDVEFLLRVPEGATALATPEEAAVVKRVRAALADLGGGDG